MRFSLLPQASLVALIAVSSLPTSSAWGNTDPNAVASPRPSAKSAAQVPSLWKKIRDNTHLMYWSMFTGPSLSSRLDQTVRVDGTVATPNFFHAVWTGVKLDKNNSIGVQHRLLQDFATTRADGSSQASKFSVLSPRLYWRRANIVDNRLLNFSGEFRWEIPTTDALRQRGNLATAFLIENLALKLPNKKLNVGASFLQAAVLNNAKTANTFALGFIPNAGYTFNPRWSLFAWGWIDTETTGGSAFRSMGAFADADYFRIGPMYSPIPEVQIYPCVQGFFSNLSSDTLTFGLELSAAL